MRSIAIDGPSGAGKSTLARQLAKELGFLYVDTGAIYRTVALKAQRSGVQPGEREQVIPLLNGLNIRMGYGEDGLQHMYLINLTGTSAREVVWNLESITAVLAKYGANVLELADKTVPDFPVELWREQEQDNLVGRFINRMDSVEDETLKNRALQYGLQALLARDEKR